MINSHTLSLAFVEIKTEMIRMEERAKASISLMENSDDAGKIKHGIDAAAYAGQQEGLRRALLIIAEKAGLA